MKNLLLLIFIFSFSSCQFDRADRMFRIKMIRGVDGDTFYASDGKKIIKIRMAYIDAPEIPQRFGLAANYVLDSAINNKELFFYYLYDDKYKRSVGVVYDIATGKSINEFMVERGMAWVYEQYGPKMLYEKMLEAKKKKKGLWQNPYPTPPDEYRITHKDN